MRQPVAVGPHVQPPLCALPCPARRQVDGELARGARQYRGFGHAARSIAMREGVRGLWSGIGPGVLFQVSRVLADNMRTSQLTADS